MSVAHSTAELVLGCYLSDKWLVQRQVIDVVGSMPHGVYQRWHKPHSRRGYLGGI